MKPLWKREFVDAIYKVESYKPESEDKKFPPQVFHNYDDALSTAEFLHRRGYGVTVYKDDDIDCEYEQ